MLTKNNDDICIMSKEERLDDDLFYTAYKAALQKQQQLKKKYEYLQDVDSRHLVAEYTTAQAKELCSFLRRLKQTPFKALEAYFRSRIDELSEQFYIMEDEFGSYVPDEARLKELVLPEFLDEEQDEIEKRASRLIDK